MLDLMKLNKTVTCHNQPAYRGLCVYCVNGIDEG